MPKSYLKQPFVVTWTSYTKCYTVPLAEKHIKYIFFVFSLNPGEPLNRLQYSREI